MQTVTPVPLCVHVSADDQLPKYITQQRIMLPKYHQLLQQVAGYIQFVSPLQEHEAHKRSLKTLLKRHDFLDNNSHTWCWTCI